MTVQIAAITIIKALFIQGMFLSLVPFIISLSSHHQIFSVIWPPRSDVLLGYFERRSVFRAEISGRLLLNFSI